MAVVIVITERGAGPPGAAIIHARTSSDICESTIAIVAEECAAIEISDVHVVVAIVVIVADCDTKSPAAGSRVQARLSSDVSKGAILIVVVEPGLILRAIGFVRSLDGFERRAANQQNVGPAVVVVIEEGHPAAHRLHDVALLRTAAGELEIEPGLLGDILKMNGTDGRLRSSCSVALRRRVLGRAVSRASAQQEANPKKRNQAKTRVVHFMTRPEAMPPSLG